MRALPVVVVLLALVLTGCGGSGNPASEAFGGLSDADAQAVDAVGVALRSAGTDFAALGSQLQKEDLAGARASLDSAAPKLDQADDKALDADNSDLRTTLQDYVRTTRGIFSAYDRWVAYFEDDSTPRDQALEDKMLSDINTAVVESQKADQAFLNRILDKASPEQRKEIRARYRQAVQDATDGQ